MSGIETRLLEQIRSKHEEIERLERMVMKELTRDQELSSMEQLSQGHRLRSMTKSIILKTEKLVKTYQEKKDEIAEPRLGGETEIWNAFSNRLKEIHEYHEKKHPSGQPLLVVDDADYEQLLVHHDFDGAPIEVKVEKLCNVLDEAINRTKQKMGEKQEIMEEDNKPMGWDGKPIPYWLNQLGLGQEYKCEICRNHSYWGKNAFERHFQQPRHQWALFSFGILDREKMFNGITSIQEAKQLWKSQGGQCKDEEEDYIYKQKLSKYQVSPYSVDYYSDDIETDGLSDEYMYSPPLCLDLHEFTYRLPEGITAKELDLIKLLAEFRARYGRCFNEGFRKRMVNDSCFEFLKKPTEGRSTLFGNFLSAYSKVILGPPFQVLKEKLTSNAADIETILENCYHRLQWERFPRERFVKKAKEELPRRVLRSKLRRPPRPQLDEQTKRPKY